MKLSRCGGGIAALALVLALFAFFFDTSSAVIACSALVVLLTARALLFLSALSSTASSVTIQRSLSAHLARQGFPVTVETEVLVTVPPGFSAEISDLPPHETILSSGSTSVPVENSASFRLRYILIPRTTGEHAFEGIRLFFSDPFFSCELVFRSPDTTAPSLVILPSLEFPLVGDTNGELNTSMVTLLETHDVRSFHEALMEDHLRKIDWKLSAKYDTLFVREYMRGAERSILLIIDLPDATLPFSTEAFDRLKEAVVSVIATQTASKMELSVLLICGPNMVSFTALEPDARWLIGIMNKITPIPQIHNMYRYTSNASLKRRFIPPIGSLDSFSRTLNRISSSFLANRPPSVFESQVARVFYSISVNTAYLFTLAAHDTSHIRIISELAAIKAMNTQIYVPKEAGSETSQDRLKRRLTAKVEVF